MIGECLGQLRADEQLLGGGALLLFFCVKAARPSLEISGESKSLWALVSPYCDAATSVLPQSRCQLRWSPGAARLPLLPIALHPSSLALHCLPARPRPSPSLSAFRG